MNNRISNKYFFLLFLPINLVGQVQVKNDFSTEMFYYHVTVDYNEAYLQIFRSSLPITSDDDSAFVEFDIMTLSGISLIDKDDSIIVEDKDGIKYFVFDSLTNRIQGYLSYGGFKRIWVQKDMGRYNWGPIVFMLGSVNYHKPSSFTNVPVKIVFRVSHFYYYGMRYSPDGLGISCQKELSLSQLNEIKNDFNFLGLIKPIYANNYGCSCTTYTTEITPMISR